MIFNSFCYIFKASTERSFYTRKSDKGAFNHLLKASKVQQKVFETLNFANIHMINDRN